MRTFDLWSRVSMEGGGGGGGGSSEADRAAAGAAIGDSWAEGNRTIEAMGGLDQFGSAGYYGEGAGGYGGGNILGWEQQMLLANSTPIDWTSIIGPMPGTVNFDQYADPNYYSGGAAETPAAGGGLLDEVPTQGFSMPAFTQPFTSYNPIAPIEQFTPAALEQLGLSFPSMGVPAGPSYQGLNAFSPSMPNLNSPLAGIDIQDMPPENYDPRDARAVAGVAYSENRGNGLLGMQSVMNAGTNRAISDFSGRGYDVAGEMTARGQFAPAYTGQMDPMLMDMAGLAVQGQLPDLVNGYQSFRADRPGAGSSYHNAMEPKGSMTFGGHVFSDQAPELAGLPPERPVEYALGPGLMDEQSFAYAGTPGLSAPSYTPGGKIDGRLADESYQPTEADRMAAARAELADRMTQRANDVQQAGPGYAYTGPSSYTAFNDFFQSPTMMAYNQPQPALDIPVETMVAQAQPQAPARSWGDTLSAFNPISAAQASTAPAPAAAAAPDWNFDAVDRRATRSDGRTSLGPGYAAPAAPATREIVAAGRSQPTPAAPQGAPPAAEDYMAGYYVDPLTRQAYGTPPPASGGAPAAPQTSGWQTAAKYGLPIVGGLVAGPAGALAGAGLGWLAGKAGSWGELDPNDPRYNVDPLTRQAYYGNNYASGDPVAYQPAGPEWPAGAYDTSDGSHSPQTGGGTPAAATPVVEPPPKTLVRDRAIHMPLRNDWLYTSRYV